MSKDSWHETAKELPLENTIVETKIDNADGIRNEQKLAFSHNLWWFPDRSMYVYYRPTHWRAPDYEGIDNASN